ncbi:hypothetical protein D3C86_1488850 [compost metagenome]
MMRSVIVFRIETSGIGFGPERFYLCSKSHQIPDDIFLSKRIECQDNISACGFLLISNGRFFQFQMNGLVPGFRELGFENRSEIDFVRKFTGSSCCMFY